MSTVVINIDIIIVINIDIIKISESIKYPNSKEILLFMVQDHTY